MRTIFSIVACMVIATAVMPCDVPQGHLNWSRSTYVQSAKIQYQQVYRHTKERKDLYYSIDLLKEAACRFGSDPDLFFMLGTFYAEINCVDTMSAYFDSVEIKCGDSTLAKDKRSNCTKGENYFKKMADLRKNKYEKAINDGNNFVTQFDTLRVLREKNPSEDSAKALDTKKKSALDQAQQCFQQAILANPKDPKTYQAMAMLYRDDKDYPKAIETYRQAMRAGGETSELVGSMAECFILIPQWDSSITWYEKELNINPKDTTALINLSVAYNNIGDFDKWHEYVEKVIALEPGDAQFLEYDGMFWEMKMQSTSSAEADIADTVKGAEEKRAALEKEWNGYADKAVASFEKSIAANPKQTESLKRLGRVCLMREAYAKAAENFEKFIAIDSSNISVFDYLGRAYIFLQKYEPAIRPYEMIIEKEPQNVGAWQHLADLYHFTNKTDKEEKARAKVLELQK